MAQQHDEINVAIRAEANGLANDLRTASDAVRRFADVGAGNLRNLEGHAESLRGKVHELGQKWHEFGQSMTNVLENVAPHLKEVLALSIAGAAAEMTHLVHEAADAVRELQNTARVLGMTTDSLEAFEMVGAQAGVSANMLSRGLLLSARRIGMVREEAIKATGNINMFSGGVSVLNGNVSKLNDLMGGFQAGNNGVTVFRASAKAALDMNKYFNHLILDVQRYPSTAEGMTRLNIDIAKSLMAIKDPMMQAALGMRQFGRGYRDFAAALVDLGPKLEAAKAQIEASGLGVTEHEKTLEKSFHQASALMEFYFDRVKNIFGIELGRAWVELYNGITSFVEANGHQIRIWAMQVGDAAVSVVRNLILAIRELHEGSNLGASQWARDMVSFFTALPELMRTVSGAFHLFIAACNFASAAIKTFTGYDIPGWALATILVLGELTGVFGGLRAAIALVGTAINVAMVVAERHPLIALMSLIAVAAVQIYQNWGQLKELFLSFSNLVASAWTAFWRAPLENLAHGIDYVIDKLKNAISYVMRLLGLEDDAVDKAHDLPGGGGYAPIPPAQPGQVGYQPSVTLPDVNNTAAAPPTVFHGGPHGGAPSNNGGPTVLRGHAAGGIIRGPGTGTSDSISARLSDGEYVVKERSVSKYGVPFLDALNEGRFANGGFVDRLGGMNPRRFAAGGYVGASEGGGSKTPVHIHLPDGKSFEVAAEDHVAGALVRYAGGQQMRSAGTKPSWYGGQG